MFAVYRKYKKIIHITIQAQNHLMNNESSQKADKLKFSPFCDFVIIPLITNKGAYASHKIIGSFGESTQIIIEKYYHARKVYYIRN